MWYTVTYSTGIGQTASVLIYWNYCHVSKILVNKDTISKTVMKDETITANGTAIYDFKGRSKINIPGKYV